MGTVLLLREQKNRPHASLFNLNKYIDGCVILVILLVNAYILHYYGQFGTIIFLCKGSLIRGYCLLSGRIIGKFIINFLCVKTDKLLAIFPHYLQNFRIF